MSLKNHLGLLALILFSSPLWASKDAKTIFKDYSKNIVQIVSELGVGTGFFYSPELIITNRHVVFGYNQESKKYNFPKKFILHDRKEITAYEFLICSRRVDVCIISLEKKNPLEAFRFTARKLNPGEDVFVIGHPQGLQVPILSTGIVSSNLSELQTLDVAGAPAMFKGFTTNAAISPGSSGSPVISKKGELLGIITGFLKKSQNLNLVVSANEINDFFDKVASKTSPEAFFLKPGFEVALEEELKAHLKLQDQVSEKLQPIKEEKKESSVDPNAIRKILLDSLPFFRYCYQKEVHPLGEKFIGVVVLNFLIGEKGKVQSPTVVSQKELPTGIESCLKDTLSDLEFPVPKNGPVEIKQPINFYPKES